MNTKRGALTEVCSAFSSARPPATSGRPCSAACRVLSERDLVTIVKAPDRTRSNPEPLRAAKPQANVIERQIRLRCDGIEQPLLMLVQRRTTMAGAGLGVDAAGRRPALDPADRRRGTDVDQTRRLRALSPSSTIETTRSRRSFEYPFATRIPAIIFGGTESDLHGRGTPYNPSD